MQRHKLPETRMQTTEVYTDCVIIGDTITCTYPTIADIFIKYRAVATIIGTVSIIQHFKVEFDVVVFVVLGTSVWPHSMDTFIQSQRRNV